MALFKKLLNLFSEDTPDAVEDTSPSKLVIDPAEIAADLARLADETSHHPESIKKLQKQMAHIRDLIGQSGTIGVMEALDLTYNIVEQAIASNIRDFITAVRRNNRTAHAMYKKAFRDNTQMLKKAEAVTDQVIGMTQTQRTESLNETARMALSMSGAAFGKKGSTLTTQQNGQ